MTIEYFDPGSTIFEEGDSADKLYVIVEGHVTITKRTGEDGAEEVLATYSTHAQRPTFGELALWSNKPRAGTARTDDSTNVLTIASNRFERFLTIVPEFAEMFAVYESSFAQLNRLRMMREGSGHQVTMPSAQTLGKVSSTLGSLIREGEEAPTERAYLTKREVAWVRFVKTLLSAHAAQQLFSNNHSTADDAAAGAGPPGSLNGRGSDRKSSGRHKSGEKIGAATVASQPGDEKADEPNPERDTMIRSIFDTVDADKSGYIDAAELSTALGQLELTTDAHEVIRKYAIRGKGTLTYGQFAKAVRDLLKERAAAMEKEQQLEELERKKIQSYRHSSAQSTGGGRVGGSRRRRSVVASAAAADSIKEELEKLQHAHEHFQRASADA